MTRPHGRTIRDLSRTIGDSGGATVRGMLAHEEIDRLAEFDATPSRVLRVYLDLDPSTRVRRAYRIAFEDLVKGATTGHLENGSKRP